jgi:pentatricopeptide repeat protein
VQVDCFGLSSLHPTQSCANACKNDARPSANCYPYAVRLACEIDQRLPDFAKTTLPDELIEDIAPPAYERNQKWLEEATAELMDLKTFPIGTLTPDDVESIVGLMSAWVRRRSVDAALVVEELLKRVVDDLRAGNRSIKVTTRLYTIAMNAWAKSGAKGTAQRAHHIHDAMINIYKETGDPAIAPSNISYNTLLNAWGKSSDGNGLVMAEQVLQEMIQAWMAGNEDLKPDAITFTTIMSAYSRSNDPNAAQRAEELFNMMDELHIKKNMFTYSALQNVYARSNRPNAPQLAQDVLEKMLKLYRDGDFFAKANVVHFNAVLIALSRTPSRASAFKANEILRLMETPVEEGGYGVAPDRHSFALTILACARCPDATFAADTAESNLRKIEARAKREEEKRLEVSSAAPPAVSIDVECFNVVLHALAKSRYKDAVDRSLAIIGRMEEYAAQGNDKVKPNIRSWNLLLNAFARSPEDKATRAEEVLTLLYDQYESGEGTVKPNSFSWAAVLSAYHKSRHPRAAARADDIVRKMEELYEEGKIETPPDVYHYTIVCAAWAKSKDDGAQARCIQILAHMVERHNKGYPGVKPNTRTYNAVLDCLSRGRDEEKTEQLLYHMLGLYRQGDIEAGPDAFSFNSAINAFTRCKREGSGRRAEAILGLLLDFSRDENPEVRPDTRSFTHIIGYYARCKELDAPYRAEYILNRLLALFAGGTKELVPTVFAFTSVMDAYAYSKHPDAGVTAERLLKRMRELKDKYDIPKFEVNNHVYNCVMFAWSSCGDQHAGPRAEICLGTLERGYASGNNEMKPDTRSYGLALNAWSRSSTYGKAARALAVLRRMQEQHRNGNKSVEPNEHAFALVINSCAFSTGSSDEQQEAFGIAVAAFDEMLESDEIQPSSLAYGWFIQACGRLNKADDSLRQEHLAKAFKLCCENGLVNDFVMIRFRAAATEDFYKKALDPVLSELPVSKEPFPQVTIAQLPKEWTRNQFAKNSDDDPTW